MIHVSTIGSLVASLPKAGLDRQLGNRNLRQEREDALAPEVTRTSSGTSHVPVACLAKGGLELAANQMLAGFGQHH